MGKKALMMCNYPGCKELIKDFGYCAKHQKNHVNEKRKYFHILDQNKTEIAKKFYSSSRWTKTSLRYRMNNPLCKRCKAKGFAKIGDLVHHNPDLNFLLGKGLNPFDDKFLETICNDHHLEELRKKKGEKKNEKARDQSKLLPVFMES